MGDVSPSDNSVAPQSSGASAQSNQQTAFKKVRFNSVSPQTSGMSAQKEVSLDSILQQISSGLHDQARDQTNMLHHSPMVQQHDPTSKQHMRKSDLTVSCRRPVACQHTRKSVWTVSCRRPAVGCRIKQEIKSTVLHHSPVVQQRDPTSKQHTRKSDSTVSCRRPAVCQHMRKSVWTVSCCRPAVGCRIKQEIKSQPANCTQESQP
jgi:hypothetical protein